MFLWFSHGFPIKTSIFLWFSYGFHPRDFAGGHPDFTPWSGVWTPSGSYGDLVLIVGWWFEPLWKIWKSVGIIIPNIYIIYNIIYICGKIKNVPNHQPNIYIYNFTCHLVFPRYFKCISAMSVFREIWGVDRDHRTPRYIYKCIYIIIHTYPYNIDICIY